MTRLVDWFRTPAHDVGLALIVAGVALIAFTLQIWS